MKIRSGYVSNSSSSSFVAVGFLYPASYWDVALEKLGIETDSEYFTENEDFTLMKASSDNDIPVEKMIVASDYFVFNDNCFVISGVIDVAKANKKLLEKGFKGELVVVVGVKSS